MAAKKPAWKRRAVRDVQRGIAERARREARAKLNQIATQQRDALRRVRGACRRARGLLRSALKEERRRVIEELRSEHKRARADLRSRCAERQRRILERATTERDAVRRAEAERLRLERQLSDVDRRHRQKVARIEAARREESDHDVTANLPPELVPVFERRKHRFKGTARKNRLEQFLEWVEEHPEDVAREIAELGEMIGARQIAELEKAERKMAAKLRKKRPRFAYSEQEIAALEAAGIDPFADPDVVPF